MKRDGGLCFGLESDGTRDYAGEMAALIERELADGEHTAREIAQRIYANLSDGPKRDRELLNGWLHAQTENLIYQWVRDRDRRMRTHVRMTIGRDQFRHAAEAYKQDEPEPLLKFTTMPFTVAGGVRKELGRMNKADLLFAADRYQKRANENAMTEAFLRALTRKVGRGVVSEHYTEDQLAKMWASIRNL